MESCHKKDIMELMDTNTVVENYVESEVQQMSLPSWKGERRPVTFMEHVDGLAQ